MIPVRQSTAFEIAVGPVLDADGVAVTDCVVADFKIKKTTGNFAALNGSATLTHVSAGVYDLVLTTSDVDTVGIATVAIDDTVNACSSVYLQVVEEAVYDALYAASAPGYVANAPVNVAQFGGSNGTFSSGRPEVNTTHAAGTAWGSGAITNAAFASDAITADKVAADVTTEIQSGLATAANLATVAGYLDTEIAAILADTNELQTDWANGGRLDLLLDSAAGGGTNPFAIASGTIGSTGNSTTALHLTGLTYGNDELNDCLLIVRDVSESEYHARWVDDWVLSSELATVATLPFTPQNATDTYVVLGVRRDVMTSTERNSIATALLDLTAGVETGATVRQGLRLMLAALAGNGSGYPGGPAVYKDTSGAISRINAVIDGTGNRTVTRDVS